MKNKNLYRIEFDKVLEMLSNEAFSQDAKDLCISICPEYEIETVKKLLKQTLDACQLSIKFGFPPFDGIKCISNILNKANSGAVLSNLELLDISSTLRCIRRIKGWKGTKERIITSIDHKFEEMIENNYLENKISKSVISENDISDESSTKLAEIRRKINHLNNKIKEKMNKIINSVYYRKYLMDPIITIRSGRFVIPVKSEYKGMIKGLVHDISSSGLTIFVEPIEEVEDNNKINELRNFEKNEIERILSELSREVANFSDTIYKSYIHLIELDVIFAKASIAFKMKAVSPKINDKGIISVKSAKHPLIPGDEVQPVDIELGKTFDTLIITGPNTGGKTVSIKTLGLMCVMPMCGLMIPARDDSEISVFKNIFTDIGDEQSIEKSISTFSSHMKNIIGILSECKHGSLVLVDEIGSGTDPEEGAALAISIIEALREKGCKVVVTTHYKELKKYAVTTKEVQSAYCEFDLEKMKPTYKLHLGGIGVSNALIIAQKLGINNNIIKHAEELLGEEKINLNKFLNNIEKMRREIQIEKEHVEQLYQTTKKDKEEAEKHLNKIEKERDKILEESRAKASDILYRVKMDSERILRELNSFRAEGQNLLPEQRRLVKNDIKNLEKLTYNEDKNSNEYIKQGTFKKGERVFISNIGKEGMVYEESNNENILVHIGSIKAKVNKKHLKHIKNEKIKEQGYKSVFNKVSSKNKTVSSMRIDLRGKWSDEAIHELSMFVDNSIMLGSNQITIIHGKGTGSLRREVHKYLKNNKNIANFRLGVFGEGEDGVTIAILK